MHCTPAPQAASYVNTGTTSKVRLFNLSPDTSHAGMTSSASGSSSKEIATNVAYGLGSSWVPQPSSALVFGFKDDLTGVMMPHDVPASTATTCCCCFFSCASGCRPPQQR